MIEVRNASGVAERLKAIEVRDGAGTAVPVKIVQIRDATGAAKTVWQTMSLSVSPSLITGYASSTSSIDVTTGVATATIEGGTAPFSYAWTRTDAGADSWSIIIASAASTAFRANAVAAGADTTAEFTCTVTDANGLTATASTDASAMNFGGYY